MSENYNPNKLYNDDKMWVEEVSKNFNKYIKLWMQEFQLGNLEREDIMKAAKRVSEYKGDIGIFEEVKRLISLIKK